MSDEAEEARDDDPRRAYVLVLTGRDAGTVYALDRELIVGRGSDALVRVPDQDVSRRHARLAIDERDGSVWLEDLGSRNGTLLNGRWIHRQRARLRDGDRIQIGGETLLRLTWQDRVGARFLRSMLEGAARDPRTGLYTAQHFAERLDGELSYAARNGVPISLVWIELDGSVRERIGARAAIARALEREIRSEDLLAGMNDHAMALLVRGVDAVRARALADRLAARMREQSVSIHVGIASSTATTSASELLRDARAAAQR